MSRSDLDLMADPETLAIYAERVAQYEALGVGQVQLTEMETFFARLPEGAKILDLGCGPGQHAALMDAHGFDVLATDATPEFVEAAKARGVNAHVARFDDLRDVDAFDAIYASFSLLHAPKVKMPEHLAAITRALRPNGWLFWGSKLGSGEARDKIGRFYAYYTELELTDLLETAGFEVVHSVTGEEAGLSGEVAPFILLQAQLQDA